MKEKIIGIIIVVAALAIGIGGAYALSRRLPTTSVADRLQKLQNNQVLRDQDVQSPRGGMMGRGFNGQMPGYRFNDGVPANAVRLTIDEVQAKAEEYAVSVGANLHVAEVMEFSNNFYAVVVETDSKKAAFELLIDPYSGQVSPEMGANMMWNQKYGRMGAITNPAATNTLTMTEAVAKAQVVLDKKVPGAIVKSDGKDFYGYYSFDYEVNGIVAGMLSVNGNTGQVLLHFWHNTFISEKEF